jgi:hypothetical protein
MQLNLVRERLCMLLLSVREAPRLTKMSISSFAYCRRRGGGAGDYPFLVFHREDPDLSRHFPVQMRLQGSGFGGTMSTLSIGHKEIGRRQALHI